MVNGLISGPCALTCWDECQPAPQDMLYFSRWKISACTPAFVKIDKVRFLTVGETLVEGTNRVYRPHFRII